MTSDADRVAGHKPVPGFEALETGQPHRGLLLERRLHAS